LADVTLLRVQVLAALPVPQSLPQTSAVNPMAGVAVQVAVAPYSGDDGVQLIFPPVVADTVIAWGRPLK
jgi:hypothetical protein